MRGAKAASKPARRPHSADRVQTAACPVTMALAHNREVLKLKRANSAARDRQQQLRMVAAQTEENRKGFQAGPSFSNAPQTLERAFCDGANLEQQYVFAEPGGGDTNCSPEPQDSAPSAACDAGSGLETESAQKIRNWVRAFMGPRLQHHLMPGARIKDPWDLPGNRGEQAHPWLGSVESSDGGSSVLQSSVEGWPPLESSVESVDQPSATDSSNSAWSMGEAAERGHKPAARTAPAALTAPLVQPSRRPVSAFTLRDCHQRVSQQLECESDTANRHQPPPALLHTDRFSSSRPHNALFATSSDADWLECEQQQQQPQQQQQQ